MSMATVVLEGIRRPAAYAAMLFSLNAPQAAAAQPPVSGAGAAAALVLDGSIAGTGLTLAAHHLDVQIAEGSASVQQHLLLRNDTAERVAVQYLRPDPAHVVRAGSFDGLARNDLAPLRDESADLSPQAAERIEAEPGRWLRRYDVIAVAPGEQIIVEAKCEVPVVVAGNQHRLQLHLPVDPGAPWVPRFTADVRVEADRPIRHLSSPTHPVLVEGLGGPMAQLSVAEGLVHRQAELTIEFELDAAEDAAPSLALERTPAARHR